MHVRAPYPSDGQRFFPRFEGAASSRRPLGQPSDSHYIRRAKGNTVTKQGPDKPDLV